MQYCAAFDPETEIVPSGLFGPVHRRLSPHIYTEAEIRALLAAAAQLPPRAGLRLRPCTYVTLFGLPFMHRVADFGGSGAHTHGCGPPAGRAQCAPNEISQITPRAGTSHHRRRLDSVWEARRQRVSDERIETFLTSDRGTLLDDRTVHYPFAKIRGRLEWIGRGGYARPGIHDLRHSWMCHALVRAYQQRQSVDHVIDVLSTDVGHARVSDTYWYVTAIPELLALAGQRFAHSAERGVS
jgi:integrase